MAERWTTGVLRDPGAGVAEEYRAAPSLQGRLALLSKREGRMRTTGKGRVGERSLRRGQRLGNGGTREASW